jgi:hypothetical protein
MMVNTRQPQEIKPIIMLGMAQGKMFVIADPNLDRATLALYLTQATGSVLTTQTPNGADIALNTDPGIQVPNAETQKALLDPSRKTINLRGAGLDHDHESEIPKG